MRDRALLLIGFAGALRRSELVGIAHEDLRFTDAGLVLTLPRSKTDPEGEGASLGIPRYGERDTCPVRALDAWLRRSGIQYGRVSQSQCRRPAGGAADRRRRVENPPPAGRRRRT